MVAQTWVKSALTVAAILACAAAGAPHAPAHTRADVGFVSSLTSGAASHHPDLGFVNSGLIRGAVAPALRGATCGRAAGSLALRASDEKNAKPDPCPVKKENAKNIQQLSARPTMSYLNWMAPSVPPEMCDEGKVVEIEPWCRVERKPIRIGASRAAVAKKPDAKADKAAVDAVTVGTDAVPVVTASEDTPKPKSRKPDGVLGVHPPKDIEAKKAEKLAHSPKTSSSSKGKSSKDKGVKDSTPKVSASKDKKEKSPKDPSLGKPSTLHPKPQTPTLNLKPQTLGTKASASKDKKDKKEKDKNAKDGSKEARPVGRLGSIGSAIKYAPYLHSFFI